MTLAPHSAFLIAQGLETLALRLQRESDSALALARWLEQHPRVGGVSYAGLPGHPSFPLVQKYLPRGAGAVLTFDVDDPSRFLSRLRVLRIAPNLGDVRTLVVHPGPPPTDGCPKRPGSRRGPARHHSHERGRGRRGRPSGRHRAGALEHLTKRRNVFLASGASAKH